MSISDDIKQGVFKSEHQKLLVNLLYTGNWIYSINSKRFKKFDLSMEQYNILRILRGQHPNPVTVNLLIERMLNKMSNASRLVEKMKAKGLVTRQQRIDDRRAVDVLITDKGLELITEIEKTEEEWISSVISVNNEEAKTLNNLLDKLRQD
jgi:DNA-binding MarR family transcriptional regulator